MAGSLNLLLEEIALTYPRVAAGCFYFLSCYVIAPVRRKVDLDYAHSKSYVTIYSWSYVGELSKARYAENLMYDFLGLPIY